MHPPARAYLERKQNEGKSRREALRCLKQQLARTVYSTLKKRAAIDMGATLRRQVISTIWLADAVEGVAGRIVSVDVDAERIALARDNLERAGLEADLRVADAAETLAQSESGARDVVFLDAERGAYAGYWPDLLRALRRGGLLVVDNVISHADEVASFLSLVSTEPAATSTQVPIGAGVQLIVKNP